MCGSYKVAEFCYYRDELNAVMSETTLAALRTDTGERFAISDLPLETLRELSEGHLLRWPQCNGLLTLKAGNVRTHHFAHTSLTDCSNSDHEPESDSHRAGKLLLYHAFKPAAALAAVEQHLSATDQRADVFMQQPD